MRKYTNILLLSAFLFTVSLMLLGTAKLNNLMTHTDLKDPYHEFQKIELPAFKWVAFQLGGTTQAGDWDGYRYRYSHSARIEPGAERVLYVHKTIADSVHHTLRGDTLFVYGANPDRIVYLGAILKCPNLNGASINIGELELRGGRYDSLQVSVGRYAEAVLIHTDLKNLQLRADDDSTVRLDSGAVVQNLRLNLGYKSTFTACDAVPERFDWTADASARMIFTGKSQQILRR